jgi:hypothetical protein
MADAVLAALPGIATSGDAVVGVERDVFEYPLRSNRPNAKPPKPRKNSPIWKIAPI